MNIFTKAHIVSGPLQAAQFLPFQSALSDGMIDRFVPDAMRAPMQRPPIPLNRDLEMVLTSASTIKITAACEALRRSYLGHSLRVRGVKTDSQIGEQPYGLEETFLGAANRLDHAKQLIASVGSGNYLFASIENGLVELQVAGGIHCFDVAVIIIEDTQHGKRASIISGGMELPSEDIDRARQAPGGFQENTLGAMIAARTGCDPQDPHSYLTENALSRHQFLVQGLRMGLIQLWH